MVLLNSPFVLFAPQHRIILPETLRPQDIEVCYTDLSGDQSVGFLQAVIEPLVTFTVGPEVKTHNFYTLKPQINIQGQAACLMCLLYE
jgi:hypothetical protein